MVLFTYEMFRVDKSIRDGKYISGFLELGGMGELGDDG